MWPFDYSFSYALLLGFLVLRDSRSQAADLGRDLEPQHLSIIVSTYNAPSYLALVLRALGKQDYPKPYEVVVADDGSEKPTAELIAELGELMPYTLIHAWHEDRGFRLAAARNHAVSKSSGDYLIFLDGDCIVRPDFLSRHTRLAQSGHVTTGCRVRLSEKYTIQLLRDQEFPPGDRGWLSHRLRGDVNRLLPLLHVPYFRYRKATRWRGIKGGNLGLWCRDFERVNGYDETYVGWGCEDYDLGVRLLRSGLRRKEGRSDVPAIHLWHEETDRSASSENKRRLERVLSADYTWSPVGLKKGDVAKGGRPSVRSRPEPQ